MANIPSLLVNAVTTFDGKALAKGEKQIGGLEKSTKKLAKAFLAAFSVQKIVQFGKAASKAFIEDEKAATRLAQSVQNLGLAFETPRIEEFIRQLAAASGVTDDQLRPSMQKLLQTTGSLTKSTALLTQALDISRGSGVDYETVVNDLTMAYTGQTRGLNKYKLGLSQVELKAMSFTEIQDKLAKTFTGANAAYLNTYAGQLGILTNAAGEAQETIGKGLVDSLSLLAGDGNSIQPLADSMEDFSIYISDAIYGIAVLINKIKSIPGADLVSSIKQTSSGLLGTTGTIFEVIGALQKLGLGAKSEIGMGGYPSSALGPGYIDPNQAAREKAEKEAAKREKERLARERAAAAAAAKKVAADKQKLALSKATAVFDSNRITLAAALQATYDKETKLRLEALMLIEEDKGELALKKIGELAAFQKNADMQKLAGVEEISNATLGALNTQLLTELRVINDSKMAEGNKELAREEAFKKYNAAITAAGTLMNREAYNERVQIQLTEIQRLASISKTGNAAITATRLAESAELSMIDRVAIAQKAADDQRLKALADYTSALNKVGISGGSNLAPSAQTLMDLGPLGGLAAGVIAGVNPGALTPPPTLTTPSPNYGWNPTMGFPGGNSVDITVNAGIGDPEAIARAVEDILNQSGYRGTSVNRNTGVYAV
jgi:hypothetical protein